jgi:uncharacterized protein YidB (DUF937 family)
MASKMPSMTALLGLLAIAGYQNRDKIAEMLKGAGATGDKPGSATQPGLGGVLGNLGGKGATGGVGGLLGGGLGELLERFKQSGQGEVAQSWVNDGPNKEIAPPQLKQAIGADVLAALEKQTGLSQDELLARLSPGEANRPFAGRASRQAFARIAGGRRQVHAGRPASRSERLNP